MFACGIEATWHQNKQVMFTYGFAYILIVSDFLGIFEFICFKS